MAVWWHNASRTEGTSQTIQWRGGKGHTGEGRTKHRVVQWLRSAMMMPYGVALKPYGGREGVQSKVEDVGKVEGVV